MKKISNDKRIIQKRYKDKLSYNDADFRMELEIQAAAGTVIGDFEISVSNTQVMWSSWNIGTNANRIKVHEDTNTMIKTFRSGVDGNGDFGNNYINFLTVGSVYFSDLNFNTMRIKGGTGLKQYKWLSTDKTFTNVEYLYNTLNLHGSFVYVTYFPNLKYLEHYYSAQGTSDDNYLLTTKLEVLKLGATDIDYSGLFSKFPPTLKYFHCLGRFGVAGFDLSNYFTGNRIGVSINCRVLTYSGGAIFPSILEDSLYGAAEYIVYQQSNIATKLTSDMVSRFIVDFANQVTACNLRNKRMRFQGSTPNTSYTDNSQPLFTTYASALAHITNTLGITVQFT